MNLLVTGAWHQARDNLEYMEKCGHQVAYLPDEKTTLPCEYAWVEGIIGNGIFLSHPIEKFVNLTYIQLTSAGFDRVPMDYVIEHNITIYNARGVYSIPMAEYAVCGVLTLYKQTSAFFANQQRHVWEKRRDLKELFGQTVCILGCGSVGTECAKRFEAFGCTIIGIDISLEAHSYFSKIYRMDEIDAVLKMADIVVITLPLTKQTRHMFDAAMFHNMKRDAVLVNIARGAIVDTAALITALQEKLYGAVLDVFEEEPLATDSSLWEMGNVIITPHNSFVGDGNGKRLASVIINNLHQWRNSENEKDTLCRDS